MATKRHKKRGSTLTLAILLVVLIAITAYLVVSIKNDAKAAEFNAVTLAQDDPDDLAETTLINAGDMAPDFTVDMLDGSKVTLSKLQGKPTLLIFWATWCPPCRMELSKLQEHIIDRYGDSINVLPISRGEERKTVENFVEKMGYTFPIGLDGDQSIYKKYASNYIPRSVVVGKDGKVVYVGVGYDEEIAKAIDNAITEALK